ncbi:unnamed protein product [Amoebophrya sp. A120]|nr:unnamed protein product [Amoebophrya sp. A120]|eukprot:GSA120T00000074001.1
MPTTSPKKANYQGAAINAQAYLKSSGMERFLNQCVNSCVQQRVNDPYVFMLRKLTQNLTEAELQQFGLVRTAKEKQIRISEEQG